MPKFSATTTWPHGRPCAPLLFWAQITPEVGRGPNGAVRIAGWRRAADVLEKLRDTAVKTGGIGNACGWDDAIIRLETGGFVSITGDVTVTVRNNSGPSSMS